MHMQARMITVVVMLGRICCGVGVVLHVSMTGMVVVMDVTSRVVLVGVHDSPRVGSSRDGQCHAHDRRERKHQRQHRP